MKSQSPITICSRCEFAQHPGTCKGTCDCLADPAAPVDIAIRIQGACPKAYFDGSWVKPEKRQSASRPPVPVPKVTPTKDQSKQSTCLNCGGSHRTESCPIPADMTPEIARFNVLHDVGGCGCSPPAD